MCKEGTSTPIHLEWVKKKILKEACPHSRKFKRFSFSTPLLHPMWVCWYVSFENVLAYFLHDLLETVIVVCLYRYHEHIAPVFTMVIFSGGFIFYWVDIPELFFSADMSILGHKSLTVPLIMFSFFFFFLNYYYYFFNLFILFIICFWLCWVFVAAHRLSLVAVSRGYSSLRCTGFSLRWLLLLQSTGSRRAGFSSCGTQAQ